MSQLKNAHSATQIFFATISIGIEPSRFSEAIFSPQWCDAMRSEIDALEQSKR